MKRVFLLAPVDSPIRSWVDESGYAHTGTPSEASAIVFHAAMADEARHIAKEHDIPSVACLPIVTELEYWFVADNAMDFVEVAIVGRHRLRLDGDPKANAV